jgi:hypothetical protein
MKKLKNISLLAMFTIIGVLGVFNSCVDEQDLKSLPYLFRPINFTATMNSTLVTFNWAKVDSAKSYTLELAPDSANFVIPQFRVTTTDMSYVKELAGNTTFYARIKANANDSTKNSKFNTTLTFKTPKENIFAGYGTKNNTGITYSAYMTAQGTLDIKWKPGANVTHLILTGNVRDSVDVSASEAAAGEKNVSGLANATWTIGIYNGKILRGTVSGLIEGDVVLHSGDNLQSVLTAATAGQVILLDGNSTFTLGTGSMPINVNIKIRGLSTTNRPVVSMSASAAATAVMFSFGTAPISYIKMENVDFTGYCENNVTTGTKIQYMINNGTAATVSNFSFTNCVIRNFANTAFRLKNGVAQKIDTLSINGCIINDIGLAATYSIVNSNTNDLFNNVIFMNSTIYNFKNSLISRTGFTMNSISITNCNFNQTMIDPASARYFIDANTTTITAGVNIKNCILGLSGAALGANGYRGVVLPVITGSYFTTDYVDDPVTAGATSTSLKSKMTSYTGKSIDLWNNPVGGDFSLKDANFAGKGSAGDLRW